MTSQDLKPARIRMGMTKRYRLSKAKIPNLHQVRWLITHFTKTTLRQNDYNDKIVAQIDQLAYGSEVSDTRPFFFGWERDIQGKPDFCNDPDKKNVLAGLSTKRLLLGATHEPGSFVFHMYSTFKLNQVSYSVIVCEVSDRCRSFRVLALFFGCQRLKELYTIALSNLRKVFTASTGRQQLAKYVMADAETGQPNAKNKVFCGNSDYVYLICFYHVMAIVHEKLRYISDSLSERVVADISDLHFVSLKEVPDEQMKIVLEKWSCKEKLRTYFNNV